MLLLQDGRTPLHKAAEGRHLNVIELLLSAGAEVDSKDKVSVHSILYTYLCTYVNVCIIVISLWYIK